MGLPLSLRTGKDRKAWRFSCPLICPEDSMAKKKVQSVSETVHSVLVKKITRNTWQVSTLVAIDQRIHTLVQKQILPLSCSSALYFLEEACEQGPIPWIFLLAEANR